MATRAEKGLKQESARRNERLQQVRQGADVGSEVTRLVYPKKQRPYGIFREALAGSVAVGMETKKKNWLLIGAVAVLGIGAVVLLAPYLFRPKVLVTFPVPSRIQGSRCGPHPEPLINRERSFCLTVTR